MDAKNSIQVKDKRPWHKPHVYILRGKSTNAKPKFHSIEQVKIDDPTESGVGRGSIAGPS